MTETTTDAELRALAGAIRHCMMQRDEDQSTTTLVAGEAALRSLLDRLQVAKLDVRRMNRLEWADGVLLRNTGEDDPNCRFSFRDMATPPTPESPDGTLYGPTVRAVLDAAIGDSEGRPNGE